jgi:hypothetical protein
VQGEGEKFLGNTVGKEVNHPENCRQSPQDNEKGIVVNEAERFLGSAVLFNDGGSHHHNDEDCHRNE